MPRQSSPVPQAHALATQWGPGLQPLWQLSHWPPVPPHWLSTLPATHVPPDMLVQHPPLHPVFDPPQSPSHEWRAVEHAFIVAQSVATLQPHAPLTHAVSFDWAEHATHAPPLVPQADAARPPAHVPFWQHPPWHGCATLHDVVQVEPLQA